MNRLAQSKRKVRNREGFGEWCKDFHWFLIGKWVLVMFNEEGTIWWIQGESYLD